MPLRKYARYEGAQVLDLKGSKTRAHHASLEKLADFEDYRTEDGFLYARIRAISSRVNKNHDGWPSVELAGSQDVFDRHQASEGGFTVEADTGQEHGYSTFLGKPIFIDHHNSDPSRARGVIVDAKLHVDDHKTSASDPYYSSETVDPEHLPGTWVELLLEVDAKSFPKLAKAIIEGSRDTSKGIDGFSMGCDVEKSVCSICKNSAYSPEDYCNHIRMKGAQHDFTDPRTGHKTSRKSYENCYGVKFFEISAVFDPADETALLREVRSSVHKEGFGEDQDPCQYCRGAECSACTPDSEYTNEQGQRVMKTPPHPSFYQWFDQLKQQQPCPRCNGDGCPECDHTGVGLHPDQAHLTHVARQIRQRLANLEEPQPIEVSGLVQCPRCDGDGVEDVPESLEHDQPCRGCGGQGFVPARTPGGDGTVTPSFQHPIPQEAFNPLPEGMALPTQKIQGSEMLPRAKDPAATDMAAPEGNEQCDSCGGPINTKGNTIACPHCAEITMNVHPQLQQGLDSLLGHKTADNPLPQSELPHAPQDVNTLRQEKICDVCGSSMDEDTCDVCGYVAPPESFQNPDLQKAQETDLRMDEAEQQGGAPEVTVGGPGEGPVQPNVPPKVDNSPRNPSAVAHVTGDMDWEISTHKPKTARINRGEKPVIPGNPPASNEPNEQVVKDQTRPVTSSVRTASDFIAAAGATRRNETMKHTADAASGAPAVAKPDVNVDVDAVGGVADASNEAASQADSQVTVTDKGGTGVEGVSSDSTTNVDQGDEHSKNIEAIPTKTFDDGSSGVERQADPISNEPFPASQDGVKSTSSWQITALDDKPFPNDEIEQGGANQGTQPVDPVGKAEDRVDVKDTVTTPNNNSGPTDTWSGTDGTGVTKQQDPVTTDSIATGENDLQEGGIYEQQPAKSSSHIFTAMKVADLEVELGLASERYARAGELEGESTEKVATILATLSRVKKAGLSKPKTAGVAKLPVLGRNASTDKEETEDTPEADDDFIFGGV